MASYAPEWGFKLGKLYYEKTDFHLALPVLHETAESYYNQSDIPSYLKSINCLLSIYNEQKNVEPIREIQKKLQHIQLEKHISSIPKMYYTMALCATYNGDHQEALDYFEKSLNIAISQNKQKDICHIITGLSKVYMELNRLDEALKEIKTLRVFFQVLDLPKVRFMSDLVYGHILCKMKKSKEALNVFEKCYDSLSTQKDLYTYIQLLYAMGLAGSCLGNLSLARLYLSLAQKMIDPNNLVRLHFLVTQALESLSENATDEFDLTFSESLGVLTEKHKGQVPLKNQVILVNMLKLFLSHPGEVYSKEKLIAHVWRQDYNPRIHDNKIYGTIKRLRQMIEPNYNKPRYIFRSKRGYYLSKQARIHWH